METPFIDHELRKFNDLVIPKRSKKKNLESNLLTYRNLFTVGKSYPILTFNNHAVSN